LSSDLKTSDMLPGLHRVKTHAKSGAVTEYWYAWRGGPQILKVTARGDDELVRLVAAAAAPAIERFKAEGGRAAGDKATLYGLITRYLAQLDDEDLADRTKRDIRKYLDKVRGDLGDLEIKALESKKARPFLIKWRDRYKKTPKPADERMKALSRVLNWAVDQGELERNPVKGVDTLYRVDRAEIIWEPHHLEVLLKDTDKPFLDFVGLAVHSGIRLGDMRRLTWSAVGEHAIVFQTGKSRKKRTVVVPITDPLREILANITRGASVTVLNSSRGRPWSEAGLETAINRAKKAALLRAQKRGGADAKSGIEHLRIHDFRGTAATNFHTHGGLDEREIAEILGWDPETVREIMRRYISGQAIGMALARKVRENKARMEAVKTAVKTANGED
jgi:integrase